MLVEKQQAAVDFALSGHNFCLCGQAGSGKSYTLTYILQRCRDLGRNVAITATTGIACVQFPRHCQPMTIHRYKHFSHFHNIMK